jgi:hypothetical protein
MLLHAIFFMKSQQNRARKVIWRIPRRISNKFDSVKSLSNDEFRRLTGVKKETFQKMSEILHQKSLEKKSRGGRDTKLGIEDMLLMTLEYLREYRTYFHIGQAYGISESNSYKIIKWVEDTLIKSGVFSLPGRKALLKSDIHYEVVLIDASESPIQRPKKNKKDSTLEKRKDTHSKAK